MQNFLVGLDVGSTTVKAVVVDAATDTTLWQDYRRHETRQPEKVFEFLRRMEADTGIAPANTRIFVTGSGGGPIAEMIGTKFVQEVHAVSLAVEKSPGRLPSLSITRWPTGKLQSFPTN
ncbi:MAG: hypothetical protein WA708_03775 [Acidobacteriaceae bacterium]